MPARSVRSSRYDVNDRPVPDRSGAWVATTTRTASRSPATASRSSCRATTRSSPTRPSRRSTRTSRTSADDVWNDTGDLWRSCPTTSPRRRLLRLPGRARQSASAGNSSRFPRRSPPGRNPDGTDMMAEDVPAISAARTRAAERRDLAAPPGDHRPRHRRPAVGPRALERPEQRLLVRPHRGHGVRQAPGHAQRRLHGRLRSRGNDSPASPTASPCRTIVHVVQRPDLEDGHECHDPTVVTPSRS